MSNRYEIYCINCGTEIKRIRISSGKEDVLEVDCPDCAISSTLYLNDDDKVNQVKVEISADKKTVWKNTNLNLEPIFTCPICGRFKLESTQSEFLECRGKNCHRFIEVVYT